MNWDVFISYASEDREEIAAPLAQELQSRGIKVWFDQFELKPGDSIRTSIDLGLSKTSLGVVILSEKYFAKKWTLAELGAVFATNAVSSQRLVPIWHKIDAAFVLSRSPLLADIKAIPSTDSISSIANSIQDLLQMGGHAIEAHQNTSIRVYKNGQAHGIDSSLVECNRLLLQEGQSPDWSININIVALCRNIYYLKKVVVDSVEDSNEYKRIYHNLKSSTRKTKKQRELYLALKDGIEGLYRLESELSTGLSLFTSRNAIHTWTGTGEELYKSMQRYVELFFIRNYSYESGTFVVFVCMENSSNWKIHLVVKGEEKEEFIKRSNRQSSGDYLTLTHEQIIERLVPKILERTVRYRSTYDPKVTPDSYFDLRKWQWEGNLH